MKRLYRSRQSCIIAGVCGGIAEYFNIDPSIVRILAVLLSIGSIGTRRHCLLCRCTVDPEGIRRHGKNQSARRQGRRSAAG